MVPSLMNRITVWFVVKFNYALLFGTEQRICLIAVRAFDLSTVICIGNTIGAEMKLSNVDMAQDDSDFALLFRDSLA